MDGENFMENKPHEQMDDENRGFTPLFLETPIGFHTLDTNLDTRF